MRLLKRSIKNLTKAYYSIRAKKISNLINQVESNNYLQYRLSGCIITKENNCIILKLAKKFA